MNGSYALLSMPTSNERTGAIPRGLGDFMPGSQNSRTRAIAATAVHAVNCQIQKSAFRMMPLDVCAHLPVQLVEHFRTDQLVHHIGARPHIIPEAVRRHVPGAVLRLGKPPGYDAVEEDMASSVRFSMVSPPSVILILTSPT